MPEEKEQLLKMINNLEHDLKDVLGDLQAIVPHRDARTVELAQVCWRDLLSTHIPEVRKGIKDASIHVLDLNGLTGLNLEFKLDECLYRRTRMLGLLASWRETAQRTQP
ncbi:MAG: hypothetical protein KGJ84_02035 [Elusimicrobia bacterium]|nr:hypothetical protein [Elusimicrobiota bacterium]